MKQYDPAILDGVNSAVKQHLLDCRGTEVPNIKIICLSVCLFIVEETTRLKNLAYSAANDCAKEFDAAAHNLRHEAKTYKDIDPPLYDQLVNEAEDEEFQAAELRADSLDRWSENPKHYNRDKIVHDEWFEDARSAGKAWEDAFHQLANNPSQNELAEVLEAASWEVRTVVASVRSHGVFDYDWETGIENTIRDYTEIVVLFLTTGSPHNFPPQPKQYARTALEISQASLIHEYDECLPFPLHCLKVEGLIGQVCDWINATALRPQPILTLFAVLTAFAALFGNRYSVKPFGTRLNIYVCGIAPTGTGKDQARKCLTILFEAGGAGGHIMGSDVTSDAAILKALEGNPSLVCLMDEIGLLLQALSGFNVASHRTGIVSMLMKLYSSSGSVFKGTEYADRKRQRVDIINPCQSVYGTSTKESLLDAYSGADAKSGNVNRWMIIEGDQNPETSSLNFDNPITLDPPKNLVDEISNIVANRTLSEFGHIEISVTEDAQPLLDQIWQVSQTKGPLWVRCFENTIKLAGIRAVAENLDQPCISLEHVEWARDLVLWSTETMVQDFERHVADSPYHRNMNRVLEIITNAGRDGLTLTELSKATSGVGARPRNEILDHLIESERVVMLVEEVPGTHKPVKRFIATGR
jgi:hypothetical protein